MRMTQEESQSDYAQSMAAAARDAAQRQAHAQGLWSANAGQLQDAARKRYGELKERADKLTAEAGALRNEMEMLQTMFPKQERE